MTLLLDKIHSKSTASALHCYTCKRTQRCTMVEKQNTMINFHWLCQFWNDLHWWPSRGASLGKHFQISENVGKAKARLNSSD